MVLDSRHVNESFIPPDITELPTPRAWQGLTTTVGSNLNIAEIDIECAFYRIASPPGLSKLVVLLPLRRAYLIAKCLDFSSSLVSRRLIVLAMGWNWSLFFCQAAVEA